MTPDDTTHVGSAPLHSLVGQRFDLEPILHAIKVVKEFNRLDLGKLSFYLNGVNIPVTKEQLEDWKFTGLNNKDFVANVLMPNENGI